MESAPIEVGFKEAMARCAAWNGDVEELKLLGAVIESAYRQDESDEMREVEQMALQLLEHEDQLPSLYKAKLYSMLSTMPGYEERLWLSSASEWMELAKEEDSDVYLSSASEISDWDEVIEEQKVKVGEMGQDVGSGIVDEQAQLPKVGQEIILPDRSVKAEPKVAESHDHAHHMHEHEHKDENESPSRAGGETIKARAIPTFDYSVSEHQKRIHSMAKIPKSMRKKMSNASFLSKEGSAGVLRRAQLRPKPSINNFDLLRNESDKKSQDKKEGKETEGEQK